MTVSQAAFRSAILDPKMQVPDGLTDPQGRPAGRRFDVYRNNVVVSLSRALAEGFPVLCKLLGRNNFGILAGQYLRAHPPASPLMMHFGEAMPEFLETFAPVQSLGYLPDVARLELALRRSYHAADVAALAPEALATIPADHLGETRIVLAPAVELVTSDWPIVSIWRFNMEDGPKPRSDAECALVTRPAFDPRITALTKAGAACLRALLDGKPLDAAVEAASEVDPAFDLTPVLSTLLSGGALTDLISPDTHAPQRGPRP